MNYRNVGKSGLKISEIALGSWMTDLKGTDQEEVARETVKLAYESGVNFFDCADAYSGGAAERFLGEALKDYPRTGHIQQSLFSDRKRNQRQRTFQETHHGKLRCLTEEYAARLPRPLLLSPL